MSIGSGEFGLRKLAFDAAGTGDGAISPEGERFVASSRRSGTLNLWFYDLREEAWHQGTRGEGEDIEAQWSPDGTKLAFTSSRSGRKAIWIYRLTDGRIRRLTSASHEDEYPNWSPDGRSIAYTGGDWGRRHFYVIGSGGGSPRAVTRTAGKAGACAFTPTGRHLICHSYDTGAGAITLLPLAGDGEPTPVTDGSAWDYKPTVSAAQPVVAFSRSLEGRSSIMMQRLDSGAAHPLTVGDGDDRWPNWTADGQCLFFHRLIDRGTAIAVFDRSTGQVRQVVGPAERPRYASFDPAAARLVYGCEEAGRSSLRIRPVNGGRSQSLPVGEAAFPRWSPDGRTIAFVGRDVGSSRWEVCTYELDTGRRRSWTGRFGKLKGLHGPVSWSPDSSQLVFKTETEPFEADLCALNLRTSELTKLTNDAWWDEAPAWTPDGRGVLFMSTRGGGWTWGFYRLDLGSGEITTVAGPDYVERNHPQQLVDGTILSTLAASGVEELYEAHPDRGSQLHPAAGNPVRYPIADSSGRWVTYTRTEQGIEYWLAENVWAGDSPVAHLIAPETSAVVDGVRDRPPLGPVRSPVDTRRR